MHFNLCLWANRMHAHGPRFFQSSCAHRSITIQDFKVLDSLLSKNKDFSWSKQAKDPVARPQIENSSLQMWKHIQKKITKWDLASANSHNRTDRNEHGRYPSKRTIIYLKISFSHFPRKWARRTKTALSPIQIQKWSIWSIFQQVDCG
jgi:hypothetical protein